MPNKRNESIYAAAARLAYEKQAVTEIQNRLKEEEDNNPLKKLEEALTQASALSVEEQIDRLLK